MNKLQFNTLTKVFEFRLKLYPKKFDLVKGFYANKLGYPIIDEWNHGENNRGVMFNTGGATLELLSPETRYKHIQGVSVSWEVNDVMTLWEELKDKVEVEFAPRHNSWGDTSFRIQDPEGFQITFFTKDMK